MEYCRFCGAMMNPLASACPKCGMKQQEYSVAAESPKDTLLTKLRRYKELLGETEELKRLIRPQSEFPMYESSDYKKRSLMKFFWPFMVGGIGSYIVIAVVSILIAMNNVYTRGGYALSSSQYAATQREMVDTIYGGIFAGLIVCLGIILIGLKIARSKRDEFNKNADYMNMQKTEKFREGQKNQKMIDIYQEDINEMYKYEQLVPKGYRTIPQIDRIIELIDADQAATVEEACAMMGAGLPEA